MGRDQVTIRTSDIMIQGMAPNPREKAITKACAEEISQAVKGKYAA